MSRDKSLKSKDSLARHRNVLTRSERVTSLRENGRWADDSTVIGMPKVGHRKAAVGKKIKEKKTEDGTGEETKEGAAAT